MDALTALQQRVSSPRLTAPAPRGQALEAIFAAALRAADHANMRPWRFLVIEGEARHALGRLFVAALEADNPAVEAAQKQRVADKPLRAPMVLVAVARCRPHPKVPELEQLLSAGAAVQNMINAAYAQGVGAYWRTGSMAYDPLVAQGLGLEEGDKIVGFVYLGTPVGTQRPLPDLAVTDFFSHWGDP
ncbi:nitroreductase [Exilibacterium tricleocarpae]|uniref:Putative NAD(P)H nitroreductase n=2 Tax=Exilibacterium tricleocarpae TaxID=2591008 RepID=A0A545SMX7_9GAMM|nr:nitroreductase [Exilibacterium tricleocarpae]